MQHFLAPLLFLVSLWGGFPYALLAQESPPALPWSVTEDAAPVEEGDAGASPGASEGAILVRHQAWSLERPPAGAYDRIGLHRYRGHVPAESAVLYLPGTFMNGALGVVEEDHNLFLFLARRGVDVYTLDYRTHAIPHEPELEDKEQDLSFMAEWGMGTFTGDARVALDFVLGQSEGLPLFVAGFSRGVAFAYAVAAAEPDAVRGIIALDGFFKPAARESASPEADDGATPAAALAASKRWAHDVGGSRGWTMRQGLMEAVAADPSAPAFGAEGTVGAQLAEILYQAWGPGALAQPIGAAGAGEKDSAAGASDIAVLARLMAGYDRYYPLLQDFEAMAWGAVADHPDTPIDDGWPTLRKPVFFVGSTGMGADFLMDGLASASHCADAAAGIQPEIHVLEGHGHLDVLVGETVRTDVFEPMLAWIQRTARKKP